MNTNTKLFSVVLALLLGLLGLAAFVSADSDLYEITQVKVNGIIMPDDADTTQVELDDTTTVEVYVEGTGNATTCPDGDVDDCAVDVNIKVWLGGYEYGDVEDVSAMFDIEPGVSYKKTLTLEIPDDLDVDDDENEYTLYVEIYDDEDSEREDYDLFAERQRHSVKVQDVIYDSTVDAGDLVEVEVRLENLGDTKEEDIKVEVEIDGVASDSEYLDELAAFEEDNEDEESSESVELLLSIPDDTDCGDYDLTVTVTYDRGTDEIEEVSIINIDCDEEETADETEETEEVAEVTVSLSSIALDGAEGDASAVTLTFVNTGTGSESYVVSVNGVDQWATASVSPSVVLVGPGETEQVTVTVTPDEDAEGDYQFTVQILDSEGNLVDDVEMSMSVEKEGGLFGDTGSALKLLFIILIVLIIIIGLIVVFRKFKDDDEDDEDEPEPKDGKTYY